MVYEYLLKISKSIKTVDYKVALNNEIRIIEQAIAKNKIGQDISVYKWLPEIENIVPNKINVFNINPEKEIENALKNSEETKINLYKLNLNKEIKGVVFSNCVYYDNQNRTLPVGMDTDTRMIVKLEDTDIQLDSKKTIKIGRLENDKEEASKLIIKTINIIEYTIKEESKQDNK